MAPRKQPQAANTATGGLPSVTGETRDQILVKTTKPAALLRHDISDEQLTMLGTLREVSLSGAFWTFIGIAIGGAPTTIRDFYNAFWASTKVPLDQLSFWQAFMCGAGLLIALSLGIVGRKLTKTHENMVSDIRNRKAR